MVDLLTILTIITSFFAAVLLKPVIGQLQREHYSPLGVFIRPRYFAKRYAPYFITGCVFSALYPLGLLFVPRAFFAVFGALYLTVLMLIVIVSYSVKERQPLVMTHRATRLYSFSALAVAGCTAAATYTIFEAYPFWAGLPASLIPVFAPVVSIFVSLTLYPFEQINNARYVKKARRALDNPYLIKIAITGSYGKTSVKNILKAMLETKYGVVATEGNYNTPLGIAKSVKNIDGYTDVFIAEFGARHTGDIKKLAKIVAPKYAVITGVTSQHLETFKTLDAIYAEKFSLLGFLPSDGAGVVNRNGVERDISLPCGCEYVGGKDDRVKIEDIKLSAVGSSFKLIIDKKAYAAETKLLGAHNLDNIAVAAALAVRLNVPPEKIIFAIKNLKVVPHRLQAIKNGGVTVIDDTYNANPVGVAEALAVLKQFEGRKIVITPGMVELGEREGEENRSFGEKIAEVADLVILIGGSRADKILSGLCGKGFAEKRILRYPRLTDAERDFPKLFGAGDVVIFINDLPDIYL